jgi:hypothetical protein
MQTKAEGLSRIGTVLFQQSIAAVFCHGAGPTGWIRYRAEIKISTGVGFMISMELFRKCFISNLFLAFPCLFGFSSHIHLEFALVSYLVRLKFGQGNATGRSHPLLLESDQI